MASEKVDGDTSPMENSNMKQVLVSQVKGKVKQFNVELGYGTITRDDTNEDVFVHHTAITKYNTKHQLSSLADGESVEFDVVQGKKGLEASNVTGPDGQEVKGSRFASNLYAGRLRSAKDSQSEETKQPGNENLEMGEPDSISDGSSDGEADLGKKKSGAARKRGMPPTSEKGPLDDEPDVAAKKYKCFACGRELANMANLRRHCRIHTEDKRFGCPINKCPYATGDSSDLNTHLRKSHKIEKAKIQAIRSSKSSIVGEPTTIEDALAAAGTKEQDDFGHEGNHDKTKPLSVEVDTLPTVDEAKSDVSHVDEIIDDVVPEYVDIDDSTSPSSSATPQSQQQPSVSDMGSVGSTFIGSVGSAAAQSVFQSMTATSPTYVPLTSVNSMTQSVIPSNVQQQLPPSCSRMGPSPANEMQQQQMGQQQSAASGMSQQQAMNQQYAELIRRQQLIQQQQQLQQQKAAQESGQFSMPTLQRKPHFLSDVTPMTRPPTLGTDALGGFLQHPQIQWQQSSVGTPVFGGQNLPIVTRQLPLGFQLAASSPFVSFPNTTSMLPRAGQQQSRMPVVSYQQFMPTTPISPPAASTSTGISPYAAAAAAHRQCADFFDKLHADWLAGINSQAVIDQGVHLREYLAEQQRQQQLAAQNSYHHPQQQQHQHMALAENPWVPRLLNSYPIVWQGCLVLKNDSALVQMHYVSGDQNLVKQSMPETEEGSHSAVLRISRRMPLENQQLERVHRRMQQPEEHCVLVALPRGQNRVHFTEQGGILQNTFINYLTQKQAAGIVNVTQPGSSQTSHVVHIFPPCEFSDHFLMTEANDFLRSIRDHETSYLFVVVTTGVQVM